MLIKTGKKQNSPDRYDVYLFLILFIGRPYILHSMLLKDLLPVFNQHYGALCEVDGDASVAPREMAMLLHPLSQTHLTDTLKDFPFN